MRDQIYALGRPLLFALPPETAHEATLKALEAGVYLPDATPTDPQLAVTAMGLSFANPIGMAAGYDKDARVIEAVAGLGFGFAEVGTLTPKAQLGNPQPRVFRLVAEHALINRLGFNNGGHADARARLVAFRRRWPDAVVGVNIGANKDSTDRAADYVAGVETFGGLSSYLTVNISSPNTPGLRDLQAPAELDALLTRVMAARAGLADRRSPGPPAPVPIVVKLAPDIAEADLPATIEVLMRHKVAAIAVSNTTLSRPGLSRVASARETGGLSGRPLFYRSTVMLARVFKLTQGKIPLIGIGGIDSAYAAIAKIEAGASLIQLYTGLVYVGPGLVGDIKRGLSAALGRAQAKSVRDLVGRDAEAWAQKPLEA